MVKCLLSVSATLWQFWIADEEISQKSRDRCNKQQHQPSDSRIWFAIARYKKDGTDSNDPVNEDNCQRDRFMLGESKHERLLPAEDFESDKVDNDTPCGEHADLRENVDEVFTLDHNHTDAIDEWRKRQKT